MCYRKPGLRCVNDILRSIEACRQNINKAEQAYNAERAALQALRDARFYDPERIAQAVRRVAEAREALDNANRAYQYDLDDYDATLRGQRELRKLAADAKEGGMQNRSDYYLERLDKGKALRQRKMAAYRATWGNGAAPEHVGSVPTPDDILSLGAQDGAIEVVYKGTYKERHGVCEVVAVESVDGEGRYTLRTLNGEYLHHVRGSSLRMFGG